MSVYEGPGVHTGRHAGDGGPGRGPAALATTPRHRGPRQRVACSTPELGHVTCGEPLVIVELEVRGEASLLTGDSLAPGSTLQ